MSTQVLTRTEARLWLREPMAVFWVLLFPALLLGILGSIPGFREPSEDFDGRTVVAVYVPIVIAMAIAFVGLSVLPTTLAVYRERGYLRRLQTTPVGARRILDCAARGQFGRCSHGVSAVPCSWRGRVRRGPA